MSLRTSVSSSVICGRLAVTGEAAAAHVHVYTSVFSSADLILVLVLV